MILGGKKLNFATSYQCLGHGICNDISDEADFHAKVRLRYANSNMMRPKFHFCSTVIKISYLLHISAIFTCVLYG